MTATTMEAGRHGCPVCTKRFDTVGDKKRHIRNDHTDTKKGAS